MPKVVVRKQMEGSTGYAVISSLEERWNKKWKVVFNHTSFSMRSQLSTVLQFQHHKSAPTTSFANVCTK